MIRNQSGSILATGGAIAYHPSYEYLSLGVGKTGIDYLVRSLAPALSKQGIHVGIVTIKGAIAEGTPVSPDHIAEKFWQFYQQTPGQFQSEITFP